VGRSAGVGVIIGGNATDKLGARAVIRTSLSVLALALAGLSTVAPCCRYDRASACLAGDDRVGVMSLGFLPGAGKRA